MIVTRFRRRVVTRRGFELGMRRGRLLKNVLRDVPQAYERVLQDYSTLVKAYT
jgi:hypothetical protein